MNITLYPLGAYVSGYCLPFTIELDGLDQLAYSQAVSVGLYEANYKKGDGNVLSSRCQRCGHVVIASVVKCCTECGGIFIEAKQTDEEYIVCDTVGVPSQFVGEYNLFVDFFGYSDFLSSTYLDRAVVNAGLACGFGLMQIEEAYQGQYDSDADFAERFAEETGTLTDTFNWPFTCINWDWAATELLHDFTEHDHHYFFRH